MAAPNALQKALTPENIQLIGAIHRSGSMAAAAQAMGLVPSAVSYRIRQLEDALDLLLFDRSSRQAKLTEAGHELLREGERLLYELDAVAQRVKRIATGWEPELTLAVDGVVPPRTVMELCAAFFALNPPTRLRLRSETLSGTLQALLSGQADLALGVATEANVNRSVHTHALGTMRFVYAVAPHHPLAHTPEPVSDMLLMPHRAVAVADSVPQGAGVTVGLMSGQNIFTVPSMAEKLQAQLSGLGCGFLPEYLARPYIESGQLIEKRMQRKPRLIALSYAWHNSDNRPPGRALQWWLDQLTKPKTRQALLGSLK